MASVSCHVRSVACLAVIFFCTLLSPVVRADDTGSSMDAAKAFTKLTRGTVNLFTGWVEVPKRAHETAMESGALAGWTWGILRGLGHGFIRTAAGLYEMVTFPFPAPPNYEPVIQPEYVFDNDTATTPHYQK